ncbi:homoserine kinase [Thalassomonas viridans]|uniref:Homoserine kinase n=1 Tax=Thalassomonas viridans TaxID=137584 RepID=A0AAE9Z547_9GAMM|nr:homoserine kinase [Thalassomonas viridans]WDE06229.1 homoserine kinase [Thalassomonas viridans]
MAVSVFAPASLANFSVGFDALGLAVQPVDGTLLGDLVKVEKSTGTDGNRLKVVGEFAHKLPSLPEDNIVWSCLHLFNEAMADAGFETQKVTITLEKKMPVGSGLGSSACSVVAALAGLNAFYQNCFDEKAMLKMMGQMEAKISGSLHYDNVAPCYLGGLQLMVPDGQIISRTLPDFKDCFYVMAYPGIEVSTKAAREVLPDNYSRKDLLAYGQNLAAFVDACHRQDKAQAFAVLQDVVAEPYRQSLLPGYEQARHYLLAQGSLAVGISGSGPTLFCVCDQQERAQELARWLQDNYLQTELGFVHICRVDDLGARTIED